MRALIRYFGYIDEPFPSWEGIKGWVNWISTKKHYFRLNEKSI
jgi:hypothetical protein